MCCCTIACPSSGGRGPGADAPTTAPCGSGSAGSSQGGVDEAGAGGPGGGRTRTGTHGWSSTRPAR
eukprot:8110813-Alexandrium_andersonii.AAC.1